MKPQLLILMLAACATNSSLPTETIDAPAAPMPPEVDAPLAPVDVDPASEGPHAVTTTEAAIPGATSGHTLASTIFRPQITGTLPLVVISPGFQMARTQYTSYAHHLASWGFGVILTDYADSGFFADHQLMADDLRAAIDYGIALPAIDATRIALAGHSLGGDISVLAATADPRVKAIVGWDPVDASNPSVVPEKMSTLTAALAVIGETTNGSGNMACAPSAENFTRFFAAASGAALQMTVHGADHMDWVDDPSCFACGFCTAGSANRELARSATRRLDVAWLRRQLFDDVAMQPWLVMPPEVGVGTATVVVK